MKKLLVIEDEPQLVELYEALLVPQYRIHVTQEWSQIIQHIRDCDLIVCDYHFNPKVTFEMVHEIAQRLKKPIILCSSINESKHSVQIHKLDMYKNLVPTINKILAS